MGEEKTPGEEISSKVKRRCENAIKVYLQRNIVGTWTIFIRLKVVTVPPVT
jgi:hypothetical protein